MAALWPTVRNRLVAALPGLSGFANATVYKGPNTDTPALYATVGYVQGGEFGGSYDMPDSSIDGLREDSGTVPIELVAWSGDDFDTLETQAFAMADAVDAWVRADQTLGVMPPGSTATLTADVVPALSREAVTARIVLTLTYFARH